jgi:aminoglycoside 3-N-acetyltransferase I
MWKVSLELIKLYQTVFEMEPFKYPSPSYLERTLENGKTIFLVAICEENIIAGLTAHQLPSTYYEASEVYVYDLAVHPDHQRKGIGTQLMEELKRISCQRGIRRYSSRPITMMPML